ncbi:MAG: Ankyrin repeat (3 copies) [Proteobacteria bacterium]|nr:Ankyrin repeat (3 copies) [Pseudomonadota bacterium]
MPILFRIIPIALSVFLLTNCGLASGADTPRKPHQIVGDLRQRMYAIGETNPKLERFVDAEQKAAAEIREYIRGGFDPLNLVEKNETGQTPLIAAAFMGYSEVVNELLKSDAVRGAIDETNKTGMSAWLSSNLAFRQTLWACNPKVFDAPFTLVPLLVTQIYYLQPDNPYKKTRRALEEAGAKADLAQAKQFWMDNCKTQSDVTRNRVQESGDLLETVLTEGAETLARALIEKQQQPGKK